MICRYYTKILFVGADGFFGLNLEMVMSRGPPAAKAVQELLKDFSKEACEKFLADLPDLLPADPVTATVLADAMAEAMAEEVEKLRGTGNGESSP